MEYCPPNSTIDQIWIRHGMNKCFLETVTASVICSFIVIFGPVQLLFYRKYATRFSDVTLPSNFWFKTQVFAHVALVLVAGLELLIKKTVFDDEHVYGYEVLHLVAAAVSWPMALAVLLVERHYQLPTPPSHGHGFVLLVIWSAGFICENLAFLSIDNEDWWFNLSGWEHKLEFGFWVLRYLFTFAVFVLGIKAPGITGVQGYLSRFPDREGLITTDEGSTNGAGNPGAQADSASAGSTWKNMWTKMCKLMPYMWPKNSLSLQLRVIVCILLLIGVRVTNVFIPLIAKEIVNELAGTNADKTPHFAWDLILLFVGLKMIQGGGTGSQGLLNGLRSFLWIKIQQFTKREIQVGLFEHLHSLSLRWHISRKTGEVLRIMDRGTESINGLLNYVVFNIVPTIVDIVIAIAYFTADFDPWFGLIVFLTMALYLGATIWMTEWRTQFRRDMNEAENSQRTRAVDSLLNFETVKYHGGERYEIDEYKKAIIKYQDEEWKTLASLNLLNLGQNVLINVGLLIGSIYCAYLIQQEEKSVGDYVLFGTYMVQLMVPLNWLGTLYRVIQESFINMENMFDLMNEKIEVRDEPNALPLMPMRGKVDFRNVSFFYTPEKPVLKNITFTVNPGEVCAIVGPTGAGKTTIMRLLFRMYDLQSGDIFVDNQNIRGVTQVSLRKSIGVVPQDTVLFNDTISNNIRYAKQDATDREVEEAAQLADIHEHILNFPRGYDTVVGERGLKLSGGEKQRVAIARVLLKGPLIILLDEATSSLDSKTERNIQESLASSACSGKTTIIVAHRLSTIVHADTILVLSKDGEIVERGRHEDLLKEGALYASMWNQQVKDIPDDSKVSSEVEGAAVVEPAPGT